MYILLLYTTTIKTAIYNFCGQRPPGLYDRNSVHRWFCTEKYLWWATTCRTWPATARFCMHRAIYLYSRNCFLGSPLGAAITSFKQQVVCETKVANTCPFKVNTFLLLKFEVEGIFRPAAVYTDIVHLCSSKFTQKVVPSLHKPTRRYMCTLLWSHTQVHVYVHVNGSVCAKSGGCWSRSAGTRSPQRLVCTKSSMHGSSVIKTKWSLTTEIVNSSFSCTCTWVWDHSKVHMYLVAGLYKLQTTFCVNLEQQRSKISVYSAASMLLLFGKCLPLRIWGEEKCWLFMGMS